MYHAMYVHPRQNGPKINRVPNGVDPNNNSGIQRFSHLDIPTHISKIDWYFNFDAQR
jgi:hypothetical protein